MGKKREKVNSPGNIFSTRNLLIGFIIIIILLLIFNYFYPVFSFKTLSFNNDYNLGELYQLAEDGSGERENCGGKICGKCERCVIVNNEHYGPKPTCMGVDMDNPKCGYERACGKTCGDDPCERCIRYDTKDKNGETITISRCFGDWEGECKEKPCLGLEGYCSNCETCRNHKCIPKQGNIMCGDGYYCRNTDCIGDDSLCVDGIGRTECNVRDCNLNCGQCAICGWVDGSDTPFKWGCVPVKDDRYSCKKGTGSGDYNGVCRGGQCV